MAWKYQEKLYEVHVIMCPNSSPIPSCQPIPECCLSKGRGQHRALVWFDASPQVVWLCYCPTFLKVPDWEWVEVLGEICTWHCGVPELFCSNKWTIQGCPTQLPYQGNTARIWSSALGEGWKDKSESTSSMEGAWDMTGRLQDNHNPSLRLWLQQRFGFYAGIHWKAQSSMFSCKNGAVRSRRGLPVFSAGNCHREKTRNLCLNILLK